MNTSKPMPKSAGDSYLHFCAGRLSSNQIKFIESKTDKPVFIYLRDLLAKEMSQ